MLERFGYQVDVASNGREALEALQRGPYAMVLMDVHMPEMDGYEATARIREEEAHSGRHTPIVAMTANALKGDRERAIGAGMDDYLSKPIRLADLEEMLRKWSPTEPSDPPLVDEDVEDWLAEAYLQEEPKILGELRDALQSGEASRVAFVAHKFKGTAASVGASALTAACEELEGQARQGSPGAVVGSVERVEAAAAAARAALEELV
jgi:CheY-like chemotaxis protein